MMQQSNNRDIVAVIDLSLELNRFFNIDLYVGGFYQIRCLLKTAKKTPSKIDVSIPRVTAPQLFPASVVNGKAVGAAFEVLYKEEDVTLGDIIEYKAFVPLKMSKLPNAVEFLLSLELWYINKEEMLKKTNSDVCTAFECVSKRQVLLNFSIFRGLHCHRPILFDYFHLCALTFTIHGSLIGLEQVTAVLTKPLLNLDFSSGGDRTKSYSTTNLGANNSSTNLEAPSPDVSARSTGSFHNIENPLLPSPNTSRRFLPPPFNVLTFEEAVFGVSTKNSGAQGQRLQNAYQFHRSVCRLLLTAYEALELKLTHLLHCFPSRDKIRIQSVDCAKKFQVLQQNVQRLDDETALLTAIESNSTLLSGELRLLWHRFLELFRNRSEIVKQLAREHHTSRIRRFAEGFFAGNECLTTTALINFSSVGQLEKVEERLVEQLRKSSYFQLLPPLNVYCEDLDGESTFLPVVFEQRFSPSAGGGESSTPPNQSSLDSNSLNSENAETTSINKTTLVKESLSLDLQHVNRPAVLRPQTGALATATSAKSDDSDTEKRRKACGRRQLHTRSASTMTCRRRRRQRFRTVPLTNVEIATLNRRLYPAWRMQENGPVCKSFGSAPELKPTPDECSVNVDQINVNLNACTLDQEAKEVTVPSTSRSATSTTTFKPAGAFKCLNCCHSVDTCPVSEPTADDYDEDDDRKHEERKIVDHTQVRSSLEDHQTNDRDREGISMALDALALERETSVASPSQQPSADSVPRLTSGIDQDILDFVAAKERYKQLMRDSGFDGYLCSDFVAFPSRSAYFLKWNREEYESCDDLHLIICVHGLDGTCADLRMVRAFIELGLPDGKIEFLMSKRNQMDTFNDFETMTRNLVDELLLYLSHCTVHPKRISFIGHSLGNIIIRSALADPRLDPWLERLHTFLSLNGPHCGIWFVQRWKKSISLQQMSLKDHPDLRQTFMYQLSLKPCLQYFKYVLLVGSHDDHYVPRHSALIQLCRPALKDTTILGQVYTEMVHNIVGPLMNNRRTTVVRYSVFHAPQASSKTSHLLGRAAHIAVLDSDLFIEKLLTVSALRYFA